MQSITTPAMGSRWLWNLSPDQYILERIGSSVRDNEVIFLQILGSTRPSQVGSMVRNNFFKLGFTLLYVVMHTMDCLLECQYYGVGPKTVPWGFYLSIPMFVELSHVGYPSIGSGST